MTAFISNYKLKTNGKIYWVLLRRRVLFNSQLFFEKIKIYVNKTGCKHTTHTEQNNNEL